MRSWLTSVSCCLRLAVISLLLLAFQTNAEVRKAFEKIELVKIANCVCHMECLFKNA